MRRISVLFLGCGAATRTHSRVLARRRNVDLMFASRDGAKAGLYARKYGGSASFDSYDDALLRNVDVAVVATPPANHLALATRALLAGKHVVIEKPAFMQASDCDSVRSIGQSAFRRVLVAENYAYKPIVKVIRGAVERGELGDIRFVTINATKRQVASGWRADAVTGGSPLFEGGIHWMSFVASLGMDLDRVQVHQAATDQSTLTMLRYSNGAVGSLAHSWELDAPLGGLRLSKIQGTAGAITFESNGFFAVQSGRRRVVRMPAFSDPTGTRAMWDDFLFAIESGNETLYTLDMAQRDLRNVGLN